MTRHDSITVAVDGSEASSAAIRFGAREAERLDTDLHLVHVLPSYVPVAPMLPLLPSDLEATGRSILDRAESEAAMLLGSGRVTTALLDGPRVTRLLETGRHARLLALGHDRRLTLGRLFTGSTVTAVAAASACPTVSVSTDWSPRGEQHCVAAGIKSVEHSPELVRRALELASERGARVVLVHAWDLPYQYDDLVVARVDEAEWGEQARRAIERHLGSIREAYPEVQVEVRVVHGQPARVLRDVSREADLLVLARRAHAFPVGHLGATARTLIRESECPVVVVPPADQPGEDLDLVLEKAGRIQK